MNKKPFAYFLCALVLLLIAFSPFIITSFYFEPSYPKTFKGILLLWHISDWRTGGSSGNAYLTRRISDFEDNNPHVFIRKITMTIDEASFALLDGNKPDMISFPSAFEFDTDYAVPYMYGSYYIIVNTDIADENDIDLPDKWGIRPDTLLDITEFGLVYDSESGYSALPAIAIHEYPNAPSPNITTWKEKKIPDAALSLAPAEYFNGTLIFLKSDAGVLIASQRQLFEIQQAYEQNEGPPFVAYAIGGYTDMVQYISVLASDNVLKSAMSNRFAQYLFSDSAQKKLAVIGVFPAKPNLEIYQEDEMRTNAYSLLHKHPAVISPSRHDKLTDLMLRSFAGDKESLRKLRSILRE